MTYGLANYMLLDARRFGARVIVFYRDADGVSVKSHIEDFPTINQADDYLALIYRLTTSV